MRFPIVNGLKAFNFGTEGTFDPKSAIDEIDAICDRVVKRKKVMNSNP